MISGIDLSQIDSIDIFLLISCIMLAMNNIFNGKWEDLTPNIESGSVSLVLTDPPYACTPMEWDKERPEWSFFMAEMARICGNNGQMWIFARMPWTVPLMISAQASGWIYVQERIWVKQNAGGCTVGTLRKVHETMINLKRPNAKTANIDAIRVPKTTKGDKSVNRRKQASTQFFGEGNSKYIDDGMRMPLSVIHCRNLHRDPESLGHPTQKPIDLLLPLVLYSTNENDVVFDPFSGTASSLVAAKMTNRRWIGAESDLHWHSVGSNRMSQTFLMSEKYTKENEDLFA